MIIKKGARGMAVALGMGCAALLVFTAFSKVSQVGVFVNTVATQAIIPKEWAGVASRLFITAELSVGVAALILTSGSAKSRVLALAMLSAFFAGLTVYCSMLWIHPPTHGVPCGCALSRHIVEDWSPIAKRNASIAVTLALGAVMVRNVTRTEREASPG